jgi:hypothetical protein
MNLLFSLLLLITPLRMETGRLTIYQDGKKIGSEDFSITPRRGGYLVEGHTVINIRDQKADLKSHLELDDNLKVTNYEYRSDLGTVSLKIDSPLSTLEYTSMGEKQTEDVRFPEDGVIIDTNCFHHFAILLYRVGSRPGTTVVPTFVPQALQAGALTLRNLGNNTYEMDTGNLKMTATTDKEGRLIRLAVPDAKVVVER